MEGSQEQRVVEHMYDALKSNWLLDERHCIFVYIYTKAKMYKKSNKTVLE